MNFQGLIAIGGFLLIAPVIVAQPSARGGSRTGKAARLKSSPRSLDGFELLALQHASKRLLEQFEDSPGVSITDWNVSIRKEGNLLILVFRGDSKRPRLAGPVEFTVDRETGEITKMLTHR